MKRILYIFFFAFIIALFCPLPAWSSTVQVEVLHSQDKYSAKGTYPIFFRLKISNPWYIHGTKSEGEGLIRTVLSFVDSPGVKVEGIRFPEPERKKFEYTSKSIEVFSGSIFVKASLVLGEDAPLGRQVVKGHLSYQACSAKVCLTPEKVSVSISISIVPDGTPAKALNQEVFSLASQEETFEGGLQGVGSDANFWLTLLGIFLGGLALNLTPCIYPLIPVTVSYFGGRSEKIHPHPLLHAVLYILGLAFTNSILGLSAALSGGMLGSALQQPLVLIFVAGVMTTLGLSFFGFWEFRIPVALSKVASKRYGGYYGTFFMGLTLGIVAAPCLGPFILALLTYVGQKGDPFLGFFYFFILSIGLGLPLSVFAIFSGAIDRLPISGDWLLWIRKFMGWVLMGMAAYMVSPLVLLYQGKPALLTAVAIAAGIHLGWLDKTGRGLRGFVSVKRFLGVILICGGIISLVLSGYERESIQWIPYDQGLTSTAEKENKPLILDFYADWCGPCKAMEKKVFKDPEVVMLSRDFTTIRLDLTRRQPFQDEILKQYGIRGVPTVIFSDKKGIEEKSLRVESLVSKSEFLERMRKLLEKSVGAR